MESVIIVAPCVYDSELELRLQTAGPVTTTGGTLIIQDGSSRVYVARNDAVRDDFEPEELAKITASISEPVFYTVDFSDITLCRRVLLAIADDSNLLVDNDHGVLLSGADFVRVLRSQVDWDWRRDQP